MTPRQGCIVQVRKNPTAYGIPGNRLSESDVERVLKDQLILSNVRELAKHGMVRRLPHMYAACNSIDIKAHLPKTPIHCLVHTLLSQSHGQINIA